MEVAPWFMSGRVFVAEANGRGFVADVAEVAEDCTTFIVLWS